MNCKYLITENQDQYCRISQELSGGLKCKTTPEACAKCSSLPEKQCPNSVTASLAVYAARQQVPEKVAELVQVLKPLFQVTKPEDLDLGEGPGTQLKKILSWFAVDTPTCECLSRARLMNTWGPQGCRDNISTILMWLQEEALNRKIPFVKVVAKQLVLLAISRAESCTQKNATSSI
jgi:hypothetical protein